ncbi:MAG: hypothetical protein Q8Q25_00885 [bacterium]|nr:hypothetical protein [bacterium]
MIYSLVFSALLYAVPFICSDYLWWLIFLFPVPLFYGALHQRFTFKDGLIWGVVAFGFQLSGIAIVVTEMLQGLLFLTIIPTLVLVFYFALCAGFWFWLTNGVSRLIKGASPIGIIVLWIFSLWLFIIWIDQYSLWILGRCEGDFFMHPLLPLATHPQLLRLVPCIGKPLLTLLFLTVPACSALFLYKKNKITLFIMGISVLPWFFFLLIAPTTQKRPDWIYTISTLPMIFAQSDDLGATIYAMQQQFCTAITQKPRTEIIIMPESSFYCDTLETRSELLALWDKGHLTKPVHIILGAFRKHNKKYRNCLYWVYDGKMQQCFDKKHAMPLIERELPWLSLDQQKHFFGTFWPIEPSLINRPLLSLNGTIELIPYICSELFFNEKPDDGWPKKTILAICNDYWFGMSRYPTYVQKLMLLIARFRAIQWQRPIIYVSFSCTMYCNQDGSAIRI